MEREHPEWGAYGRDPRYVAGWWIMAGTIAFAIWAALGLALYLFG